VIAAVMGAVLMIVATVTAMRVDRGGRYTPGVESGRAAVGWARAALSDLPVWVCGCAWGRTIATIKAGMMREKGPLREKRGAVSKI